MTDPFDPRQYNPYVSHFPDPPFQEGPERVYPKPGESPGQANDVWSRVDSVRWGDTDNVSFTVPPALALPLLFTTPQSKQLVNTHTPRPISWLLQFNADGVNIPAGEAANIVAKFFVTIGSGQSQTTFLAATLTLLAANGYHDFLTVTVPPQIFLPAADIQVTAVVSSTTQIAGIHQVLVSCMASPWTVIPLAVGALR